LIARPQISDLKEGAAGLPLAEQQQLRRFPFGDISTQHLIQVCHFRKAMPEL
jgi:hypothetical protein